MSQFRYTPYFFDKNLLDNILEASIDQHFRTMIQNRHMQRRRDVIDDSLTAEIVEESGDSLFEPPEVSHLIFFRKNLGVLCASAQTSIFIVRNNFFLISI